MQRHMGKVLHPNLKSDYGRKRVRSKDSHEANKPRDRIARACL